MTEIKEKPYGKTYFRRKLRKERKKKRAEANKLNKPIGRITGRFEGLFDYWFPKNWGWHRRVQFVAIRFKSAYDYSDNYIDIDW